MATLPPSLDPETVARAGAQAKRHIRQRMQALRTAIPRGALEERARRVIARLYELPEFVRAERVALFRAMAKRQELDLERVDAFLRARGNGVYYPFMVPSGATFRTGFQRVATLEELSDRGRGFAEPPTGVPAARGDIDLVVVPALAVAPTGHRLGYGAGYYDVTLPDVCPPGISVAIAYDFQLLGELPVTSRDVACDIVVTETQVIRCAVPRG